MLVVEKHSKVSVVTTVFVVLSLVALMFLYVKSITTPTYAITSLDFIPGKIIDDQVFTNKSTMTVTQIQTFLNSKVPICDTNGTQTSEYGGGTRAQWGTANYGQSTFVCLKDYVETGRSAAQIIYDAAQEFQINPQVLIVLLQKEQGLVTDTWPLNIQYRSATGYGCPDTAPCDSQYYGLSNQLKWSATMFRAIMNASPTWYTPYIVGNNYIQYSPVSSCGGSTVSIENRATQALYNYTPYQPSPAALAAGWGQVGCGAYGNRNFFLYFNEWFGKTTYLTGVIASNSTPYSSSTCTISVFPTTKVGRLYQPDTQDYLYTSSQQEACSAVKLGYIWDGVVFNNEDIQAINSTPIYRLKLGSSHYYTSSLIERTTLLGYGYVDEGISFYGLSVPTDTSLPAYQLSLYGGVSVAQFITSAGDEGSYFISSLGYKSGGIAFYTTPLSNTNSSSLYRLRSSNDRLYTASSVEAAAAISTYGYRSEGVSLKIDVTPGLYSRPVYRLVGPGGRLYTADRDERDKAIINYGYYSEGIGFYSYSKNLSLTQPIYRSTNYTHRTRLFTPYLEEHYDSRTFYGYTTEDISWYGLP